MMNVISVLVLMEFVNVPVHLLSAKLWNLCGSAMIQEKMYVVQIFSVMVWGAYATSAHPRIRAVIHFLNIPATIQQLKSVVMGHKNPLLAQRANVAVEILFLFVVPSVKTRRVSVTKKNEQCTHP